MSSMFETEVNNRKNHTRWASVNVFDFAREMAMCGSEADEDLAEEKKLKIRNFHSATNDFVLVVRYRPDVASRFWFTVKWTGADGKRHQQSAQTLKLCMWRAAQNELNTEKRLKAQEQNDD